MVSKQQQKKFHLFIWLDTSRMRIPTLEKAIPYYHGSKESFQKDN